MTARFVWVQGLRGPKPEVWHRGVFTVDMRPVQPLQSHEIADEDAALPLKVLARIYPQVKVGEAVAG